MVKLSTVTGKKKEFREISPVFFFRSYFSSTLDFVRNHDDKGTD